MKKRTAKSSKVRSFKYYVIPSNPYKSDNPVVQKKLNALKSLEGIWADKDTSFFDRDDE